MTTNRKQLDDRITAHLRWVKKQGLVADIRLDDELNTPEALARGEIHFLVQPAEPCLSITFTVPPKGD
ncbi:MAG: hypothetical protein ABL901_02890 [Hyphomicrobiaceae bacterium]|nr:hypothetical protein [Hyphomicrobiaceae bacterium]